MSRIGKLPIKIPAGVEIKVEDNKVIVKGPKGELFVDCRPEVSVKVENNEILIKRNSDSKEDRSYHGLTRSLINNLVIGVSEGFEKKLEINGVGYKAEGGGNQITLHLGFSHPVKLTAPAGVSVEIDKNKKNILIVSGIDKQKIGQFAANIREFRKPEPYKGKGIRYIDEHILRKAGKKAASSK